MTFPEGKQIILFDGVCNYCNNVVNKIIENDINNLFVFAAIQSEIGQKIINYIGLNPNIDSIVLYQPGQAYFVKSEAALRIFTQLGGKFSLLKIVYVLPETLRNFAYDYFAKNRYNWYGKTNTCRIPNVNEKDKFL
jgi:predicted DCC family thiol-disulfide oxidoreductase YuxK